MSANPFVQLLGKTFSYLSEPFKDAAASDDLTEKNLKGVLRDKGISEFLKYRSYKEIEGTGIYTMSDWSKGLVIRLSPPPFLMTAQEDSITNFLSTIEKNNTVVQFITYASQNITKELKAYRDYHPCNCNVDNPEMLKNMLMKRADSYQKWTTESMLRGIDFRIRDFHNLLVVLFPPDVEEDYVVRFFDSIKGSMADLYPENYDSSQLLTLLREVFHRDEGAESWEVRDDGLMELNAKVVAGGIDITTDPKFKGFRIGDKQMARVFTTKSFPQDISLFEYNKVFFDRMGTNLKVPIPSPFLLSLTIRFDDVDKTKKAVLSRLGHDLGELGKLRPNTLKKNPDLKDRLKETEDQIVFIKQGGEVPLKAMWTLTIFEDNEKKLNEYSSSIKQRFKEKDWEIVEESSNNVALMTMLYSLPLQYSRNVEEFSKRFRVLFKRNNAAICPIIGDNRGAGDYHILFIGRTGQIQRFDPYASGTNYNIVKVGSSGSGKSYSEADFHASCLAANYRVRIIDAGDSYKEFCASIGGQYIEFTDETDVCLNFFTKINTVRKDGINYIHEDEFSTIVPLIGLMGGTNLESSFSMTETLESSLSKKFLSSSVEKSIALAFERREKRASLEDVRDILTEFRGEYEKKGAANEVSLLTRFIDSIYPYADKRGSFYSYFNGTNNVDMEKDYVVLEVEGLKNKGDMYQIVMMTLANQVSSEYFNPKNRGYRKLFGIDEAWMVFDNEIVVKFLEALYRKIRKSNGIAATIVQGIDDYFKNESTAALYNNANWKWFLQQEDVSIENAISSGNTSGTPFEVKLMKSIKNRPPQFGEGFIRSSEMTLVSRLKADTLSHWTYTNSPKDIEKLNSFSKKHGIPQNQGRWALSLVFDGYDVETAVAMAKNGKFKNIDRAEQIANVQVVAAQIIKNPTLVTMFTQSVIKRDEQGTIDYREVCPHVKNDYGLSYKNILELRSEIPMFEQCEIAVVKRVLESIVKRTGRYSINLSLQGIMGGEVVSMINSYVSANESLRNRLILEIPIADMRPDDEPVIQNAMDEFRKNGIAISNVGLKNNSRIGYVLSFNLDYVKIDSSMWGEDVSDASWSIISGLEHMCRSKGVHLIAIDISSESDLELVKSKYPAIEYVQGSFVAEQEEL